eukprot:TRINITY_DN90698_c0_g1_i1.p1 TRINITY_DN90698_c0_g1~~TRINITY_DN90698_c0_g1_i1.p1  ORF type:complete len:420 (+),score=53.44 TRINITY_DN90698_c0_g1_i1:26-1261(+)
MALDAQIRGFALYAAPTFPRARNRLATISRLQTSHANFRCRSAHKSNAAFQSLVLLSFACHCRNRRVSRRWHAASALTMRSFEKNLEALASGTVSSGRSADFGFQDLHAGLQDPSKDYPAHALHPDLFKPGKVEEWLLPEVLQALGEWRSSQNPRLVDLELLPDIRVEAPGVVSFGLLRPGLCERLLEEAKHYADQSMFPSLAPNSMNKDGCILNDIGLRPVFTFLLRRYLVGIAGKLFGSDEVRAESLGESPLGTENWGGAGLSDHHTFITRYAANGDRSLDMHVDESDVTFNIGLSPADSYDGGDLVFCGMFGDLAYRKHHHTYRHELGRCVVHAGKRRHSVMPIERGERASLIMWTKSITFRSSAEYKEKCDDFITGRKPLPEESGPPDPICLSMTHDGDYLSWAHLV